MKVDFVHHDSYELRSPLTTIIGFAHFLSDPSTGPLTPKQAVPLAPGTRVQIGGRSFVYDSYLKI